MYDTALGQALNHGQSMIPGKSRRDSKNIKRAVLKKKKAHQPKGNLGHAIAGGR